MVSRILPRYQAHQKKISANQKAGLIAGGIVLGGLLLNKQHQDADIAKQNDFNTMLKWGLGIGATVVIAGGLSLWAYFANKKKNEPEKPKSEQSGDGNIKTSTGNSENTPLPPPSPAPAPVPVPDPIPVPPSLPIPDPTPPPSPQIGNDNTNGHQRVRQSFANIMGNPPAVASHRQPINIDVNFTHDDTSSNAGTFVPNIRQNHRQQPAQSRRQNHSTPSHQSQVFSIENLHQSYPETPLSTHYNHDYNHNDYSNKKTIPVVEKDKKGAGWIGWRHKLNKKPEVFYSGLAANLRHSIIVRNQNSGQPPQETLYYTEETYRNKNKILTVESQDNNAYRFTIPNGKQKEEVSRMVKCLSDPQKQNLTFVIDEPLQQDEITRFTLPVKTQEGSNFVQFLEGATNRCTLPKP